MIDHPRFEEMVGRYWQLLRRDPDCNLESTKISKKLYIKLMERVYKLLLPLYRQNEVRDHIEQEWIQDSQNQNSQDQQQDQGLNFQQLAKLLFRIANEWATNIDLDEYLDLLEKILLRISQIRSLQPDKVEFKTLYIKVEFPEIEKLASQSQNKEEQKDLNQDWIECKSDEDNMSNFEYKYEEDPENMMVKKYKKPKIDSDEGLMVQNKAQTIKEPIIYKEYLRLTELDEENVNYLVLQQNIDYIFPFGYFAEQTIRYFKNEIHQKLQSQMKDKKQKIQQIKKEARANNIEPDYKDIQEEPDDIGLIEEGTSDLQQKTVLSYYFDYDNYINILGVFSTNAENYIRKMIKNAQNLCIRLHSEFPKPGAKTKNRNSLQAHEPITEMNKFGYNPALERRICYKNSPLMDQNTEIYPFTNIYYMVENETDKMIYRADVQRVETKNHMAINPGQSQEKTKEEEFINVETSLVRVKEIMLQKKFGNIHYDRQTAEGKEQKRVRRQLDKEEKRRENAQKQNQITQKGMGETFEEKSFIKMMRGPFFSLDSKQGCLTDNFVDCSEQDLIDIANQPAPRILVIGKPRSGKTTICRNLALKDNLDLIHINIDNWIAQVIEKVKNYEPPEDLEEGQDPPPFLSPLEDRIYNKIQKGEDLEDEDNVEILKEQIKSPQAKTKGYFLDLTYYQRAQSWASTIRQEELLKIDDKMYDFSHVIEINLNDEEILNRAEGLRYDPVSNGVYSVWEREERKKPKIVNEDDVASEDEDEQIKPFDENTLIHRIQDREDRIRDELQYYNTVERPSVEELLLNLYDNQYLRIEGSGLNPVEINDIIIARVRQYKELPLRPIAYQIEGCGDYKSMLTEGVEENFIPRKWSYWKQTDPVALYEGKLMQGLPDYACSFYNNAFAFATEENMKAFLLEPKKYLKEAPKMPSIYRVLMLGAPGTGKHTQAQNLQNQYGWKIIDFQKLIKDRLDELFAFEIHVPNNPVPGGRIGLSEKELQDIQEGKPFQCWRFIPWIFDELGFELMKRPPAPVNEEEKVDEEELTEEEIKKKKEMELKKKKEEDEKRKKEEEEINRLKEERRRRRQDAIDQGLDLAELGLENEDEEIIIIEDLNSDQLVLKVDEETNNAPFVGGFILLGFPESEEQLLKLKEYGIEFDRVIVLQDTNEDEPGKEIKERMASIDELYEYELEVEQVQKVVGIVKEQINDEIVKEISCNGDINEVFIRIRNECDPFYTKIDNPDDVRVTADLGEEDKKLPKSDFGEYCPVTFVSDGWLFKSSSEFEVTVNGKTYWCAGEKEQELFKFNPLKYMIAQNGNQELPLKVPEPRIMVIGHKGAGVTTQIRYLCDKFKLKEFNLQEEYLKKLKEEKDKRKRQRLLNRGFKPPQPPDEEGEEPPPDPEIEEDPDDFDRAQHERDVLRELLDFKEGIVIDGTWTDLPEDAVSQPLQELLIESRRVPEIVIMLKCKEKCSFDRLIDYDGIKQDYENKMQARENERIRLREIDRKAKYEEVYAVIEQNEGEGDGDQEQEGKTEEEKEEEMKKWDEERDAEEEANDENDPDKPNLEEMLEKEKEKLIERRQKDSDFMQEFADFLREKNLFVIDDIKADQNAQYVFLKIVDRIKDNFQFRRDLIERMQCQILMPKEVKFYEQSYIFKHSKFGINSPVDIYNPIKNKQFAVLYRERIYFPSSIEEQEEFMKQPSKYTFDKESIPLDLSYKPTISIIGFSKSGKSTLAKKLHEKLGVVHLKVAKIVEEFLQRDSVYYENLKKKLKDHGGILEEDILVNLVIRRLQFPDCQQNGWIIEDFPKTKSQAMYMAKKGVVPNNIFNIVTNTEDALEKANKKDGSKFSSNKKVFLKRIQEVIKENEGVLQFYQKYYNNVQEFNMTKSKWYVEDLALKSIKNNQRARMQFAKYYSSRPCLMKYLTYDRCLFKQSLSEFKYFCPVSWKNEKLFVNCSQNYDDVILYNHNFYYFKSNKEVQTFLLNPSRFINNTNFPQDSNRPWKAQYCDAASAAFTEKAINGHCPTTLINEKRVQKGWSIFSISYQEQRFVFENEQKLLQFYQNPYKYSKAQLPVKMPPNEDKISLFNLSKMEDSISFMEQALGQIVTRALREISENRMKYPTLSVKETMLKLFALFLRANNPANTKFMKEQYEEKMKLFIKRCEISEEIYELYQDKQRYMNRENSEGWSKFKEDYYNNLGKKYDQMIKEIKNEKIDKAMSL